jgi:hypothetical protein
MTRSPPVEAHDRINVPWFKTQGLDYIAKDRKSAHRERTYGENWAKIARKFLELSNLG